MLKLKYSGFRNDARPAYATLTLAYPPVVRDVSQQQVAEIRPNKMFETIPERIKYLRDLLARLPDTPANQSQRATLLAELSERLTGSVEKRSNLFEYSESRRPACFPG